MSYAVKTGLAHRDRTLFHEAPYFPSDPRDPTLPLVGEAFRIMLSRSVEVLRDYLVPVTHSYDELRRAILVEQLLSILSSRVDVRRPDEVRQYLLKHPDMMGLVHSACNSARGRLQPQTQLLLGLYRDPEIDDEYLTLYVRQSHYEENVLQVIDHLNRESATEKAGKSGWLVISTDFRSPE